MRVTAHTQQLRRFSNRLQTYGNRLQRNLLSGVPSALRLGWQQTFQEGQRTWPALRPFTIEDRRRKGYPPTPTLVRDGTLLRSFVDAHSEDHVSEVSEDEIVIGSSIEFAPYLHHGTRNMAARPLLNEQIIVERVDGAIQAVLEDTNI